MKKKTIIIGIETSCDETAVSILEDNGKNRPKILSNVVSSQFEVHKKFGGVVPDLAARAHLDKIDIMTKKALKISKVKLKDIDAVAATAGPGLIVCLSVGLNFAKALSLSLKKPFIAVNHLEGHALSPKLNFNIKYPYLLFLISGGHTQYLTVKKLGDYKRLGTTIDDALGEAFDKKAKLLNLGYPGGPKIEELARKDIVSIVQQSVKKDNPISGEWDEAAMISSSQINFIDNKCRQLDINVMEFINCGEGAYDSIEEVEKSKASAMLGVLNKYQTKQSEMPQGIMGYNKNWRS